MFDTIKKWWNRYWDWVMALPEFPSVLLGLLTLVIPIFILSFGLMGIVDSHFKTKCLDSQLARRWKPSQRICEEYHDDEWIKADLSGASIYYYNEAASREH